MIMRTLFNFPFNNQVSDSQGDVKSQQDLSGFPVAVVFAKAVVLAGFVRRR